MSQAPCKRMACDWSRWRKWSYETEGARWILSEPQVRDCKRCGRTQRLRWWRR